MRKFKLKNKSLSWIIILILTYLVGNLRGNFDTPGVFWSRLLLYPKELDLLMLKNKKKSIYKLYIYVNHAFKILALLPTHFSQNIFRKLVALTQSTLFTIWLSRSAVVHVGAWPIWLHRLDGGWYGRQQSVGIRK